MKPLFTRFAIWQLQEVRKPNHYTAIWEIVTVPIALFIIVKEVRTYDRKEKKYKGFL